MWLFAIILLFAYVIIGLVDHILSIIKYYQEKEKELDEKYPFRKKLEE